MTNQESLHLLSETGSAGFLKVLVTDDPSPPGEVANASRVCGYMDHVLPPPDVRHVNCTDYMTGSYVTLYRDRNLYKNDQLVLCEVVVMGAKIIGLCAYN